MSTISPLFLHLMDRPRSLRMASAFATLASSGRSIYRAVEQQIAHCLPLHVGIVTFGIPMR